MTKAPTRSSADVDASPVTSTTAKSGSQRWIEALAEVPGLLEEAGGELAVRACSDPPPVLRGLHHQLEPELPAPGTPGALAAARRRGVGDLHGAYDPPRVAQVGARGCGVARRGSSGSSDHRLGDHDRHRLATEARITFRACSICSHRGSALLGECWDVVRPRVTGDPQPPPPHGRLRA